MQFFSLNDFISVQDYVGNIEGRVIDKTTKEGLPGVNVLVVGTGTGSSTDENGNFKIPNLTVNTYQVKASAVGYNSIVKTDVVVNSSRPAYLLFELTESVVELQSITVKSDYFESSINEPTSTANFSYEEIRRSPGGFEDVVRALSILPGVGLASPGRNDLIVRGGAPSENLYIVDGFEIPNINHFGSQGATGGPLSYINLDFVRESSFSTGGFSALYGDKLSSVLKIDLRQGRDDRIGGKATISASQFGLNLEGPIGSKANFIFSARRSYLDFIFNAAGFSFVPEYYDLLSKVTYDIDNQNKLSYLFIGALDRVNFNNNDAKDIYDNSRILGTDQNQYITGLSLRHLFNKGFVSFRLERNFMHFNSTQRDTLLNPVFKNISSEAENKFLTDLVIRMNSQIEINAGFSFNMINFDADILLPDFTTTFDDTLKINSLNTNNSFYKSSAYFQTSYTFDGKIKLSGGLRADYFSEVENTLDFSPRFSVSYLVDNYSSINFSTGIYHQSPSYVWLTAYDNNKNLKSIRVEQYILGYERRLQEDIKFKIEGFIKDYHNYPASLLRTYLVLSNTGAGYGGVEENFSSFGLEPLVSKGRGIIRGIELSVQKKLSDTPFYGIAALTYSKSLFTALDNIERPGSFDQNWIFNLTGGYKFNSEWEASLKFRFASGAPYTPFNSDGTQSVNNYNTLRLPDSHSLDIRVDKRLLTQIYRISITVKMLIQYGGIIVKTKSMMKSQSGFCLRLA